jgi:hypothetical protein
VQPANKVAYAGEDLRGHRAGLASTQAQLLIFERFYHVRAFREVDTVLPPVLSFLRAGQ